MLSKNILRLFVSLVFSTVLAFPLSAAADVEIDPGYITGTVSVGTYTPYNTYVTASGNGYSSSKTSSGGNYSLTVQGGDWPYNVSMRGYFRPTSSSYPYAYVYFNNDSFKVPAGETVTNDYINEGATVRFHVTITGDDYDNWYSRGYAYKNVSPSVGEKTQSNGYMYNYTMSNAVWDMPVIPNEQVRIYAYVRVRNGNSYQYYYFWWNSPDLRYEDIAPGDVLDVYLDVTHVYVPNGGGVEYGSVQGNIQLNNVDSFSRHYVWGGGDGEYVYTNPGPYLLDRVRTGYQYFYAQSYFDNNRTYFRWPYTDGDSLKDRILIEAGGVYNKDFIADAGTLQSQLKFSGSVNDEDLYYRYSYANGIYRIYDPVQGWVRQPTYGGSAYSPKYDFDPNPSDSRLFLTPGPWETYRSYARDYDYDSGYYQNYQMNIYDYNYYYDGNYYNFGQNAEIAPAATTVQDKEYCTGALVLRYRVAGGGLISYPYLSGSGNRYREDGKRDLQANIYGNSNIYQAEAPTVTVHGPEANYNLRPRFTAADGSQIIFPNINIDLECGVWKGLDLNGPTITVTYPPAGLITNAQTVTVTGTVTDESGVASVSVNGNVVPTTPAGDPADPNKVEFSYDLNVVSGENIILVEAVDTVVPGNEASNQRSIYVDHWMPTATIVQPTDSYFSHIQTDIPVEVTASDQGYGFSLVVSLDGSTICQADGPANDLFAETIGCTATIPGPLSVGDHVISATATDIAGNSYTITKTITSYLAADLTVKPEARHNLTEGTSSIFVTLPNGYTAKASLATTDNREISSGTVINPRDVRYNSGDDKLIQKYDRTPDLMGDEYFTVEGIYCPNPNDSSECYTWRGSDTTKW